MVVENVQVNAVFVEAYTSVSMHMQARYSLDSRLL
jgi:hypothetical protein